MDQFRKDVGATLKAGNVSKTNTKVKTNTPVKTYKEKVTADIPRVRKEANSTSKIVDRIRKGEVYTIVEEKNGWGKLKSGIGWISLSYVAKV